MKILAIDTESNALDVRCDPHFKMLGLSYSFEGVQEYLPIGHIGGPNLDKSYVLSLLQSFISSADIICFHNAKYDIPALIREFPEIDWWRLNWYCTMLMSHMIDENFFDKSLDALGLFHFGIGKEKSEAFKTFIKGPGWAFLPVWLTEDYAKQDAKLCRDLFRKLYPVFQSEGFDGDLWEKEKAFVQALHSMEQIGVAIDTELSQSEYQMGQVRMAEIVCALGNLNPSSPKDLEELLINRLGLPLVKPTKGTKQLPPSEQKPSFDRMAMEEYEILLNAQQDKTAQLVLEYRGWQKACSTYFRAFLDKQSWDGKIRPNFKVHGTRTSRLSCEIPNLQQIPKETTEAERWGLNTKKCIVPTSGYRLWELDYSNLELRLSAIYSGQLNLVEAFNSGQKIWDYMSSLLGGWEKNKTKTVTYATLYGAGNKKLADTMGVPIDEAADTKGLYFDTFPQIKQTILLVNDHAKTAGYIKYWTGRRRHFPSTESPHKAFNSLIQGSGAEVVKWSLIEIWETLTARNTNPLCKLVLTIHDSLVLEIKKGYEQIYLPKAKEIMERIPSEYFGMFFGVKVHEWAGEEWNTGMMGLQKKNV